MMQRKRMSLVVAVILALAVLGGGAGTALAGQRPSLYTIPGENIFPEGIAYQRGSDSFFVSSAGNGAIYRGELDNPTLEPFLPAGADGRVSATGMQVTDAGELLVSGAATGKIFVYDLTTKALKASFQADPSPSGNFINDVALTQSGAAYFTNSFTPAIYRATPDGMGGWAFEVWLDPTSSGVIQYQDGFNLNGIVATADGKYLITVQSNTGKLFRISLADKSVAEIDLGGQSLPAGDGLVLNGSHLYVVQNANQVTEVKLKEQSASGEVTSVTTDPSFSTTTTAALAKGRLLVVNSQFGGPGLPPFTVSSIKAP